MHYRAFSDNNYASRLRKRFDSLTAIWLLFEEQLGQKNVDTAGRNGQIYPSLEREGVVSLDNWLLLTAGITGKYEIDPVNARDLFMYVQHTTPMVERAEMQILGELSESDNASNALGYRYVTKAQFFRLLSLLYVGARCHLCTSLADFVLFTDRVSCHQSVMDGLLSSNSPSLKTPQCGGGKESGIFSRVNCDRAVTVAINNSFNSNTG